MKENNFYEECREIAQNYQMIVEDAQNSKILWKNNKIKFLTKTWNEMYSYLSGYDESKKETENRK